MVRGFFPPDASRSLSLGAVVDALGSDHKVDVIVQRAPERGWTLANQSKQRWPLSRVAHNATRPEPRTRYAVNVDIGHHSGLCRVLNDSVPEWMRPLSKNDMLRFSPQQVPGMNAPQLYIKVPGVWTGAHEENNCMRSVNICHGPGESVWFAVAPEHTQRVAELVRSHFSFDMESREGHHFPSPDFLEAHGIPVLRCTQRAGDLVILKGQTLHWVMATSCAVNSSWNFAFLEAQQLLASSARSARNCSLRPPLMNLIPVSLLALRLALAGDSAMSCFNPFADDLECQYALSVLRDELLPALSRLASQELDHVMSTLPCAARATSGDGSASATSASAVAAAAASIVAQSESLESHDYKPLSCSNMACRRDIANYYFVTQALDKSRGSISQMPICAACGARWVGRPVEPRSRVAGAAWNRVMQQICCVRERGVDK